MHSATDFFHSGSLTGGLTQWVQGVVARFTGGAVHGAARYPLLEDVEFTHALVGLAAKLVGADGKPSSAEYAAFVSLFPVSGVEAARLRSLFMKALGDAAPALQYARTIKRLHPEASALHREVLDRLLKVASADAALNAAEHELLCAVAKIFGVSQEEWRAIMARYLRPASGNAYTVLGANRKMTDMQLRERYMAQVRMLHPDRYQAAGASEDTIAMLSEKLAIVNAAYESIMRAREAKQKK